MQPEPPRDPGAVDIYRTVMEWLEQPESAPTMTIRMALPTEPWREYFPSPDPGKTVMTELTLTRRVDHIGLHAAVVGRPSFRISYNRCWRGIADICGRIA